MIEYVFFGFAQGLLEWLPVSSEGFSVLLSTLFGFGDAVDMALFLHLGTMLAALFYYRRDWGVVVRGGEPGLRSFLLLATVVSFGVGALAYSALKFLVFGGSVLLLVVGAALLLTGFLLKNRPRRGGRSVRFAARDALVAGALQGLAVIPGFSRSAATVSSLIWLGFDPEASLRASFLMSVPAVAGVVVFLGVTGFSFRFEYLLACAVAFVVGLASMDVLLRFARRVDFSFFCWVFGALSVIGSVLAA